MQNEIGGTNARNQQSTDIPTIASGNQLSLWQRIGVLYRERREFILGVVSILILLIIWQTVVDLGYLDVFISSKPSAIISAGYLMFVNGTISEAIGYTAEAFLAGFAMAMAIGVPLGILIGWYPTIRGLTWPYISALNATPRIALYPLFVVWFGIGMETKIFVVFISSVLPVLFNTIGGVQSLDPSSTDVARCMGANDRQVFTTVALPASVPFIMTGFRLGVGRALLAAIIAELFIGNTGLGALLSTYASYFKTAQLMAVILVIAALGIILLSVVGWVENKVEFWRPRV